MTCSMCEGLAVLPWSLLPHHRAEWIAVYWVQNMTWWGGGLLFLYNLSLNMLLTTSTDPLIGASTEIEMDTDFFKLFRVRHLGIFLRCDLDLFCV